MIEALQIFARYDGGTSAMLNMSVYTDAIFAGPEIEFVGPDDRDRLVELGWFYDDDLECWGKYV